ncbi:hypothetical protein HPP92_026025 [Vanilla planifolia]|uniref:Thaumatin-like protein n=1 Tax=Vanilla planifolia TaxID=51239 RepID=A0A835PJH7_VANPL|nr:hypothetical protein HPP92_026025 [Vanilla planifolia]
MYSLHPLRLPALIALLSSIIPGAMCATFTFVNSCGYTVWPGILSNAGTAALSTTGFALLNSESRVIYAPSSWAGRFWGRTLCSTDSSGRFSCNTGDCGSGQIECSGGGAAPPATLAEFTLNGGGTGSTDFYDVSLVDGYNIPMLVVPNGSGTSPCAATGCLVDINGICPSDLRVLASGGENVACRSACEAFGSPQFCCSGEYGNPNTCKPSPFSQFFKNACPRAYSYAYDDATSTFTCPSGGGYVITFCPSTTSQKAGENTPAAAALPMINNTMVFMGAETDNSYAGHRPTPHALLSAVLVAFFLAISLA